MGVMAYGDRKFLCPSLHRRRRRCERSDSFVVGSRSHCHTCQIQTARPPITCTSSRKDGRLLTGTKTGQKKTKRRNRQQTNCRSVITSENRNIHFSMGVHR